MLDRLLYDEGDSVIESVDNVLNDVLKIHIDSSNFNGTK